MTIIEVDFTIDCHWVRNSKPRTQTIIRFALFILHTVEIFPYIGDEPKIGKRIIRHKAFGVCIEILTPNTKITDKAFDFQPVLKIDSAIARDFSKSNGKILTALQRILLGQFSDLIIISIKYAFCVIKATLY